MKHKYRIGFAFTIFFLPLMADNLYGNPTDSELYRNHKFDELISRYQIDSFEHLSEDQSRILSMAYMRRAETKLTYYKLALYAFQELTKRINTIYEKEAGSNISEYSTILQGIRLRQLSLYNTLDDAGDEISSIVLNNWLKAYQAKNTVKVIREPDDLIAQWYSGSVLGDCSQLSYNYKYKCNILSSIRKRQGKQDLTQLQEWMKFITPYSTRAELISNYIENQESQNNERVSSNISTNILNDLIPYIDMLHTSWVLDYYISINLNPSVSTSVNRIIRNFKSTDTDWDCTASFELNDRTRQWFSDLSMHDKLTYTRSIHACYNRSELGQLLSNSTNEILSRFRSLSPSNRMRNLSLPLSSLIAAGLYDDAQNLINISIQSHQIRELQSSAGMHVASNVVLIRYLNRGDSNNGDIYRRQLRFLLNNHESSYNSEYLSLIGLSIQLLTTPDILESYQVTIH